jgi:MFS family permease
VVWALIQAGQAGWTDPEVAGALVLGVLLVAGFVAWERRAADPMLPVRLFGSRTFAAANASGFLMSGSIFSAAFLISQYMQFVLGYSPFNTGLRLLPWTATPLVIAPLAGALSDRIGRRTVIAGGLALQALGLFWFASLASTSSSYGGFVLPLIVAGIGISMALPVVPTAVMSSVSPPDMGKASGVNSTLQRFGSAFALSIAAVVFAANGRLGDAGGFTTGFRPALTVVAGLSLIGALAALAAAPTKQAPVELRRQVVASSGR